MEFLFLGWQLYFGSASACKGLISYIHQRFCKRGCRRDRIGLVLVLGALIVLTWSDSIQDSIALSKHRSSKKVPRFFLLIHGHVHSEKLTRQNSRLEGDVSGHNVHSQTNNNSSRFNSQTSSRY